ncbi:MAG: serine/threonine-protein phosphatase, partial [Bacteroidia bacterium]|nr:serine/threonine-protein phosphatase [Bacteroidia bacterium]
CADCTGHGVPGSFMTLLGINHITQIYRDFRDIEINILLDELNERICAILRQAYGNLEEEIVPPMDGMDIALCKVETDTGKVTFASAGRPMYIVRNGCVEVVKGSHRPIGGTSLMYQFNYEKYELELSPGDCIYLFSDGITDQFGADNNKKFGVKRLKELIADVWQQPMERQKELFERAIAQWKGDNAQTDDITVIGFRL